jgi:hypothetical protein
MTPNTPLIRTKEGYFLDLYQETPTFFTNDTVDLLHNPDGTWTCLRPDRPFIGEGKTAQEAFDNWARCLTDRVSAV